MRKITIVYGIKFIGSEEVVNKINAQLQKSNSSTFYLPTPIEINAYFKNVEEALKVIDFLNQKYASRHYHTFPTSIEYLDRRAEFFNNSKQKHVSIITRARFSRYNVYESAEDYLKKIHKIASTTSEIEK